MPSKEEGTAFSGADVPFDGFAEAKAARARAMEAVVKRILAVLLGGGVKRVWDILNGV